MSDQSATELENTPEGDEAIEDDEEEGFEPEVLWTSDDALAFDEARRLTSARGATVVMFAGDAGTGKTTAMVEIWTSLLMDGRLGDVTFAGTNNALAFERRSFDSRIESGMNSTRRTDEEAEGFLHLRVQCERGSKEILLADYSGEHFKALREGAEVVDELPWIGRVDRLAVFIDGALVSTPATAEVAYQRTRRILWKLRDCPLRGQRLRTALVLAKADKVGVAQLDSFDPNLQELLLLVRELDSEAPFIKTSARPDTGEEPLGLDALLNWICEEDVPVPRRRPVLEPSDRAFGRFT